MMLFCNYKRCSQRSMYWEGNQATAKRQEPLQKPRTERVPFSFETNLMSLRHFSNRTGDGAGGPVLDTDNGEELMLVQPGVAVSLGYHQPESPVTLYISSKQVIWLSDVERTKGYAVDFLSVSHHAVSRDPDAYPSPCIYAQIETEGEDDESEGSDSKSNDNVDLSRVTEMRLIPSDPSQLDTLFDMVCQCAELNPEPVDDQAEEHDWVSSAYQVEDLLADLWNYAINLQEQNCFRSTTRLLMKWTMTKTVLFIEFIL